MQDNFEFQLIGGSERSFKGYASAVDKTIIDATYLVHGSKNVYKKLSGTIASRFGLKRRGSADAAVAGVKSSYEWQTSLGATRVLRVTDDGNGGGKFQLESDVVTSGTYVWYDLQTSLSLTRYVFDAWWDNANKKDKLLFVRGDSSLFSWAGGVAKVASGTSSTIVKSDTSKTWAQEGFDASSLATIGGSSTQFDITNTAGNTYRYTFDGTGTDPVITSTSVPVGTYVYIGAQNFSAANNGLFVVTASAANYFEVTNASGVAESNKTIGTGFIYTKFKKVLLIGSTPYAYTGGESTTTLTGVSPSAAAVAADSVAISAVITNPNTPDSAFTSDFIRVVNNQAYIGSYVSRLVYVSSNSDFTDFSQPNPRTTGSAALLTLDATGKGIGVRQGNAHIFAGTSYVYVVTFTQITVGSTLTEQVNVARQDLANLESAYAHEFIDTVGESLVYLSQNQQLRTFGTFRNIVAPKFPSLSLDIQDELKNEDFTGGHLRSIGDYIYATAPVNGRHWMYQTRELIDVEGNITAERIWHPPQISNISRFAVIDGVVFGHSNANPQIYQVWDTGQWHDDSPSDEPIPYVCVARFAYQNNKRRQGLAIFDKVYFEGYIADGSLLSANIYFDYQGNSGLQQVIINSIESPASFFTGNQPPSMGDASLGTNPLGDGIVEESDDQELLPKYRVIANLNPTNCFEYEIEMFSTDPDCRWEVISLGVNAKKAEDQATFIRK